jgi:hypothetical protein
VAHQRNKQASYPKKRSACGKDLQEKIQSMVAEVTQKAFRVGKPVRQFSFLIRLFRERSVDLLPRHLSFPSRERR